MRIAVGPSVYVGKLKGRALARVLRAIPDTAFGQRTFGGMLFEKRSEAAKKARRLAPGD